MSSNPMTNSQQPIDALAGKLVIPSSCRPARLTTRWTLVPRRG